jgi:pimeloyl-ACP methyl ester carboxylesterase
VDATARVCASLQQPADRVAFAIERRILVTKPARNAAAETTGGAGLPLAYDAAPLAAGIRSRFVDNGNGLRMHMLEAGFEESGRPCIVLIHGFPELAYSWRKVMVPIAAAGYHVIAPDLRGYGQTTGWGDGYDVDLRPFRTLNMARDILGLVFALGCRSVAGVIGHDVGSGVAAWCALVWPKVFRSVVMSGPFAGPPSEPFAAQTIDNMHAELAALDPPRKHYQWYYATREANDNMRHCPQGVHAFLRAYYHHKSANWKANKPFRLQSWTAGELARMPTYYVMKLDNGMAETVAEVMPTRAEIGTCRWLTEDELRVYSAEYTRIGFQGGLQHYRCQTSGAFVEEQEMFCGRTLDVPACIIAGASDWGFFQKPGLDLVQDRICTKLLGCHRIEGAGHWVQQEMPQEVTRLALGFLRTAT